MSSLSCGPLASASLRAASQEPVPRRSRPQLIWSYGCWTNTVCSSDCTSLTARWMSAFEAVVGSGIPGSSPRPATSNADEAPSMIFHVVCM